MKLAIVYYSLTGKTASMAEEVAAGARTVDGMEVRAFPLEQIDPEYLKECAGVVFGTPTYYANTCWQLKKWFDEDSKGINLGGKLGAAFATANYPQGGADTAILTVVNHLLVKGMLVYSGGGSLGQPIIHLGAVALRDGFDEARPMFRTFGQRIAQKCAELF